MRKWKVELEQWQKDYIAANHSKVLAHQIAKHVKLRYVTVYDYAKRNNITLLLQRKKKERVEDGEFFNPSAFENWLI